MDNGTVESALSPEVLTQIIGAQAEIVRQGQDLGSVMDLVAERLLALTGAAGSIVELAEGGEMVYRAAAGMAQGQLGLRLKGSGSLSGLCVETGEILVCDDSETDPRVDREACRTVGLRSMVVAPLVHQDSAVGVLKLASRQVSYFKEKHIAVLQLMSELVASATYFAARNEVSELYHRATHDSLTGLANRALFYDRLRQAMALAQRRAARLGILNLDMDGLKAINDQHGHRAGDAALRELAERLGRASRQSDTVARLGGDEFGIILPEVQDLDGARAQAERVEAAVRRPYRFESCDLELGVSIGAAVYPVDATDLDVLLHKADEAMYRVKRTRKGR
jgi:diguanylate cyclase (GGDEF)-like protein